MRYLWFILCFATLRPLAQRKKSPLANDGFLTGLMLAQPLQFQDIIAQKDSLRVQVIYTKIDRDKKNKPIFTDYTFNLNKDLYFYPASTVKMPVAFLALEKLYQLGKPGIDRNTTMVTDSGFAGQREVYTSPSAKDGRATIENYIKQIFLVSDNDAFNKLYEFLGQEYIQQKLTAKGFGGAYIRHRLQIALTIEQNRATNPVSFYDTSGRLLYHQGAQYSSAAYPGAKVALGQGYYKGGQLINQPFDFSEKNKIPLQDLHHILQTVLFNEYAPSKQKFDLAPSDYAFVKHWMSAYPRESAYPNYDSTEYWDAYCKFLLHGSDKGSLPNNIRIFNKVGDAYGFLTDVAYVADTANKVEFMLSATILCNSDGVFNDDNYDYERVGLPFMKNLGLLIYKYERNRKRKNIPNLQPFTINYALE